MFARSWVGRGAGVVAALSAMIGRAWALDPSALRTALIGPQGRDAFAPMVARYRGDGGEAFTFDREGGDALLKFDDDPEIWALKPTPAPRGDVIYKNDVGQPVLRATRLGGLTLFTPTRPSGVAATFVGQATAPRRLNILGPEALFQLERQASARAGWAVQHLVAFDAPDVTPASESVYAEAFVLTAEAFVHVSQSSKRGQVLAARFADVRFLPAKAPDALAQGPTVEIMVAPQLGVSGRPSSERIAAAIQHR